MRTASRTSRRPDRRLHPERRPSWRRRLGADEPHLTVGELVGIASLFGISDGATRTCLWRMVSNGELTGDDGIYALAGPLLERRQRVDEAARYDDSASPWDGTWELAVVSLDRRSAGDRLALRKAAAGCTSPSCAKVSGSARTTWIPSGCRRCALCWTANACTFTVLPPTSRPRP